IPRKPNAFSTKSKTAPCPTPPSGPASTTWRKPFNKSTICDLRLTSRASFPNARKSNIVNLGLLFVRSRTLSVVRPLRIRLRPFPRFRLRTPINFDSKIPVVSPPEIKIKIRPVIRNERQPDEFVSRRREIPSAVRIRILLRKPPTPVKLFVRHTDDVKIKIVQRIPEAPLQLPMRIVGPIPCRRLRIIAVLEPPNRVQLVVEMNLRRMRPRSHLDGAPIGL